MYHALNCQLLFSDLCKFFFHFLYLSGLCLYILHHRNMVCLYSASFLLHHCTGIDVEPAKKQLHVTLAYQYAGDLHDKLTRLAKQIDLNAECLWELRAYSRDPRIGKSEVGYICKDSTGSDGLVYANLELF